MRKNDPDEKTRKMYEKLNDIGMECYLPKEDGTKINCKVVKVEEYKGIRIIFVDTQYEAKARPAQTSHLYDNTYLIVRNMRALVEEMKLTPEERRCIYLHEIGHMLSENQKNSNQRCLENEIDADRYAVIECGADPSIMKSALLKTMETSLKNQNRYTREEFEAEQKEMEARINSIEMLIGFQWGDQIGVGEPDDANTQNDYDEQQDENIRKNLSKYGITQAEWQAISQYKHEGYFIPSTLLHRIDIMKFNNPKYGEPMTNDEILEPQKAMDFYCNIYSAMCKIARRTRGKSEIVRVEGDLFLEELKNTGTTNSVMSFSESEEYLTEFIHDKENPCILIANLPKDIPCLDFSLLMDDSRENEILLPPFLDVSKPKLQGSHLNRPVYRIDIFQRKKGRLSNEEKEQMNKHKDSVLSSNVAQKYYDTWYQVKQYGRPLESIMKKSEYEALKEDFFEWQDSFKQYLQLRFREIENEIFMPQLSSADIQSWGNERAKDSSFKDKVINIGKRMFDFVRNNRDDDRENR